MGSSVLAFKFTLCYLLYFGEILFPPLGLRGGETCMSLKAAGDWMREEFRNAVHGIIAGNNPMECSHVDSLTQKQNQAGNFFNFSYIVGG